MHILPILVLINTGVGAPIQDHNTYGKTEAHILAMGEDGWDAFYESKAGETTLAMVEMNSIYGDSLLHRNQMLAKHKSKRLRDLVDGLRKEMLDYSGTACELGSDFTGGGTIWSPISADIETAAESVLYCILGGTAKPASSMRVSQVAKMLNELSARIDSFEKDKVNASFFKPSEARGYLKEMREDYEKIAALSKGLRRSDSDRVLDFSAHYADLAKGDGL